jgi:hypothetical protein
MAVLHEIAFVFRHLAPVRLFDKAIHVFFFVKRQVRLPKPTYLSEKKNKQNFEVTQ